MRNDATRMSPPRSGRLLLRMALLSCLAAAAGSGASAAVPAVPLVAPPPPNPLAAPIPPAERMASDDPAVLGVVSLLLPQDMLEAAVDREFDAGFLKAFNQDPQSIAVEQSYPGTRDAALAAGRGAAHAIFSEEFGRFRIVYAGILTESFTRAELGRLTTFLRSALGRKLVAMGDKIYDMDSLQAAMQSSLAGPPLTGQAIARSVNPQFVDALTDQEIKEMARFALTAEGRKFTALNPRVQAETASWLNNVFQNRMGDVQVAVVRAVSDHIRKLKSSH